MLAGEIVGRLVKICKFGGGFAGFIEQARVMDRAGSVGCKERKQLYICFAELPLGIALFIGFEDPDQIAAVNHRHLQYGTIGDPFQARSAIRPGLVIIDDKRRPGLSNTPCRTFAQLCRTPGGHLCWEGDVQFQVIPTASYR